MVCPLGERRILPRFRPTVPESVHHRHPASECHRRPAHGSYPQHGPAGHSDPVQADDRVRGLLDSRNGSRRNRHTACRGTFAGQRRKDPPRSRAGEIRRTCMGMEKAIRRRHRAATPDPGRILRLGKREVHDGRNPLCRCAGGVRPSLRGGVDLSREVHRELVPQGSHRHQ